MFRRTLIAGLAALTAAGSIAVPAASAKAQPAATAGARTASFAFAPPFAFCASLIPQIQFATATGNLAWASVVSNVFVYSHCGGAAI